MWNAETLKRTAISALLGTLALSSVGFAQEANREVFEVASIRRNSSNAVDGLRISPQPNGARAARNVSLLELIIYAYDVQSWERVEGGGRILNEKFDVNARAGRDVPPSPADSIGPFNLMMQNLLAERFKLAVQWQEREEPVLDLVLNRRDGSLGPSLRPTDLDCAALRREQRQNPREPSPGDGTK